MGGRKGERWRDMRCTENSRRPFVAGAARPRGGWTYVTEPPRAGRAPDDRRAVRPAAADAYVGRRTPRRAATGAAAGSCGGECLPSNPRRHSSDRPGRTQWLAPVPPGRARFSDARLESTEAPPGRPAPSRTRPYYSTAKVCGCSAYPRPGARVAMRRTGCYWARRARGSARQSPSDTLIPKCAAARRRLPSVELRSASVPPG